MGQRPEARHVELLRPRIVGRTAPVGAASLAGGDDQPPGGGRRVERAGVVVLGCGRIDQIVAV